MTADRWLANISRTLKDNSPHILSGIAITGVVGTAVLAVRATPLAMDTIDSNETEQYPLSVVEKFKLTWKFYIPAGLAGVASISCIVAANTIGARRQAAVVGAYTLVDRAFREYKSQVMEEIGPNKERKVRDDLMGKKIAENPASSSQIIFTGVGETLCYDSLTGRYFKSDIEAIRKACNDVNASILKDMYAPHNDFYALLGLEPVVVGEELGWNLENLMELSFSSHLSDSGQPCIAVGYIHLPIREYTKF